MRTHSKIVFIALLILATFALASGLILFLSSPHSFQINVVGVGAYYIVLAVIGYAFSFVVAKG